MAAASGFPFWLPSAAPCWGSPRAMKSNGPNLVVVACRFGLKKSSISLNGPANCTAKTDRLTSSFYPHSQNCRPHPQAAQRDRVEGQSDALDLESVVLRPDPAGMRYRNKAPAAHHCAVGQSVNTGAAPNSQSITVRPISATINTNPTATAAEANKKPRSLGMS